MKRHFLLWLSSLIISLFLNAFFYSPPVQSQVLSRPFNRAEWNWYDCPSSSPSDPEPSEPVFDIPLALKTRFPFDLVYPINPQDLQLDTECLSTSLWGIERQFCAPMQITKIAKDIFLLRFVLQSLVSL